MAETTRLLGGRYQVGRQVGRGGMGAVYHCIDRHTGNVCAVKLLLPEILQRQRGRADFQREARALEHLRHPHILRLLDYGVDGDEPYLVTELCLDPRGNPFTLDSLMRRHAGRGLPVADLEYIFPHVFSAMAFVHRQGVVHRDMKPANIFLKRRDSEWDVKIADFGLIAMTGDATVRERAQLSVSLNTQAAEHDQLALVGTYEYMSPEQMRGELLDARSDVYALGLMFYRAATGRDQITFELPCSVRPGLPEWADAVVRACVSEDKEQRVASALDLLNLVPMRVRSAAGVLFSPDGDRPALAVAPAPAVGAVAPMSAREAEAEPISYRFRRWRLAPSAAVVWAVIAVIVSAVLWQVALTRTLAARLLVFGGPAVVPYLAHLTADGNLHVQRAAVEGLDRLAPVAASAVPALAAHLSSSDRVLRDSSMRVLATLGADAVPGLIPVLEDGDNEARKNALNVLREIGAAGVPAVPAAMRLLREEDRFLTRVEQACGAVGAPAVPHVIGFIVAAAGDAQRRGLYVLRAMPGAAVPAVLGELPALDATVRVEVMPTLGVLAARSPSSAYVLFKAHLLHPDTVLRGELAALFAAGHAPLLATLIAVVADVDAPYRHAAADLLVRAGAAVGPVCPALADRLRDVDPYVAQAAAAALAHAGAPAATELVARLGRDPDFDRAAAALLVKIGQPAVASLTAAVKRGSDAAQLAAVTALAPSCGEPLAVGLTSALQWSGYTARADRRLLDVLAAVGPPALPLLIAQLGKGAGFDGRKYVTRTVLRACRRDVAAVWPELIRALHAGRANRRTAAADVIAGLGVTVVPRLVHLLRSSDAGTRAAAAEILGRMGAGARQAAPALAALSTDADFTVRRRARTALQAIQRR